jgi:hypothetical protein
MFGQRTVLGANDIYIYAANMMDIDIDAMAMGFGALRDIRPNTECDPGRRGRERKRSRISDRSRIGDRRRRQREAEKQKAKKECPTNNKLLSAPSSCALCAGH